jgi:hypothetical protein
VRFGVSAPEPLVPPVFFPGGERPRGLGDGAMAAACSFNLALMPLVSRRTVVNAGGEVHWLKEDELGTGFFVLQSATFLMHICYI